MVAAGSLAADPAGAQGFSGGSGPLSAGTTIQGNNGGQGANGLHFKCNDHSNTTANDFDIAFTGPNVSVGAIQGSNFDASTPAGNTFLFTCSGEEHMNVPDVPNNTGLYFEYWHHAANTGVQVIPTCLTNPPLIPSGAGTINHPTLYTYTKQDACGGGSMLMAGGGGDPESAAAYAASELEAAEIAAQAVDSDNEAVQAAQAAEIAYWEGRLSGAVMAYAALAQDSASGVSFADAIAMHQQYPVTGSAEQVLLLRLAAGDLAGARADVDAARAAAHDTWWDVQDVNLQLLEDSLGSDQISGAQRSALESIAASGGQGAINARAWLAGLDGGAPDVGIILPHGNTKSFMGGKAARGGPEQDRLHVFPNPTQGDVRVSFALRTWGAGSRLVLLDATGRTVYTRKLPQQAGELVLTGMPLAPGVYAVALMHDGEMVASRKLTVAY